MVAGAWQAMFSGYSVSTGNAAMDELVTRGGMESMLQTIWLIVVALGFGAVMERSQLVEVLLAMKSGRKVVAMIAPAAAHEFPGRIEQLMTACLKAGFSDVMEVALGAELTTRNETKEFIERMEKDGYVGTPDHVGRREVLIDPDGNRI